LPSNAVDGLPQNFEDIDGSVEISHLAAHGDQHCPHKDPEFLLHLLGLHKWYIEVDLFKLQRVFRVLLAISVASHVRR
jgi:hypothetical protein